MVREERQRKVNAANGAKGGNPALKSVNRNSTDDQPGGYPPTKSQERQLDLSSDPSFQKPKPENRSLKARQCEEIYQHYPRKAGHKRALGAIAKALETEAFGVLLAAVKEFAQSRAGHAGRFTPHAATWFNQERWRDDRSLWHERRNEVADGLHRSLDEAGAILRRLQGDDGRPV
jgi:hypothetical protein